MKAALCALAFALAFPIVASADWATDQTIPPGPYDEIDVLCESVRQVCDGNPEQFESHNECRISVKYGPLTPYAGWATNGPLWTFRYYWMAYVGGPNGGIYCDSFLANYSAPPADLVYTARPGCSSDPLDESIYDLTAAVPVYADPSFGVLNYNLSGCTLVDDIVLFLGGTTTMTCDNDQSLLWTFQVGLPNGELAVNEHTPIAPCASGEIRFEYLR